MPWFISNHINSLRPDVLAKNSRLFWYGHHYAPLSRGTVATSSSRAKSREVQIWKKQCDASRRAVLARDMGSASRYAAVQRGTGRRDTNHPGEVISQSPHHVPRPLKGSICRPEKTFHDEGAGHFPDVVDLPWADLLYQVFRRPLQPRVEKWVVLASLTQWISAVRTFRKILASWKKIRRSDLSDD
ncbi:hypothetical protein GGQ68_000700 [Sagittula marina]|uniref:Uncharacterized protein n=1 Tax=Sagittula marina TaxID=943940 RepID=A0A7W6DKT4_9RHOB|nr:hypothetical protein [Sagittula marina]MBB3984384.1 hypothetical protein [Sagittula marina]